MDGQLNDQLNGQPVTITVTITVTLTLGSPRCHRTYLTVFQNNHDQLRMISDDDVIKLRQYIEGI